MRWVRITRLLLLTAALAVPLNASAESKIKISPLQLDFGTVVVGETLEDHILIGNPGEEPLEIYDIRIEGDPAFSIPLAQTEATDPQIVIPPGEHVHLPIAFSPTVTGLVTAELVVESDALPNIVRVPLSGTGSSTVIPEVEGIIEHVKETIDIVPEGDERLPELESAKSFLEQSQEELSPPPPEKPKRKKVIDYFAKAADELKKTLPREIPEPEEKATLEAAAVDYDPIDQLILDLLYRVAQAARHLAQEVVDEAIFRGGDPETIGEAEGLLLDGDALLAGGLPNKAIRVYKEALAAAEDSLPDGPGDEY